MADRYHHGDLANALRCAAIEVIAERGLGGFSLREVARRAGVSHTAPAHHFGDVRGLLTAVAIDGFDALQRVTAAAAATESDPVEQLRAIGEAYIGLARSHPSHCEVMFRRDVIDTADPRLVSAGLAAYAVLEDAVRELIQAEQLTVSVDDAAWMCWSMTQGLVVIEDKIAEVNALKGGAPVAPGELMRRFTSMLVTGLRGAGSQA